MDSPAAAAAAAASDPVAAVTDDTGLLSSIYVMLFGSPVNAVLTTICAWLLYRLVRPDPDSSSGEPVDDFKMPDPLEKHNMTLDELKKYNGTAPDGRVCIAILGKVYDCTRGRKFYGPNGPYSTFAGRDATRALATFDVNAVKEDYDDHSDLTAGQMSSVEEWQMQLSERYDYVGLLVRPEELEEKESTTTTTTTAAASEEK